VVSRSEIVSSMNTDATSQTLQDAGFSIGQVRGVVEQAVQQESLTLAINHMFLLSAGCFVFAAAAVWFAPRPKRAVGPGAAH
jgi:DHA2 family multidrug resistance protein